MPRLTGLKGPKCSCQAFWPSHPCVMESPRKITSPTPLLCSMRLRKSLCRGMSRLSFLTAGLSSDFSCADRMGVDKLSASTQPAGSRRYMVLSLGDHVLLWTLENMLWNDGFT